jgi:HEAT repeat protein
MTQTKQTQRCCVLWPVVALLIVGLCCLLPHDLAAQESDRDLLRRVLDKVDQLERDLRNIAKSAPKPLPENPAERKLVPLLETPVLMSFNQGSPQESRVFVAKLMLINLTAETKTVEASQITLNADGNSLKNGELSANVQDYGVQIGQQSHNLQSLKPTPTLKLASGSSASTWILFSGLPKGAQIPRLQLKIASGDKPLELDINAWGASKLDLSSKRLGPRGCLALLTIGGELNSVSLGSLLDEFERLSSQKVTRVVVRWAEGAPAIDQQLSYWLVQSVQSIGRGEVYNQQFPTLPNSFTELRLSDLPATNAQNVSFNNNYGGPMPSAAAMAAVSPIHKTTAEAVIAALRTAYEAVPRNELLDEIRTGDALTRSAALAGGGGRLASEHLPLILQLADDNETSVQRAALLALRHYGEKDAIDKLLQFAKKNIDPVSSTALESLASSRYADAHDALLGLLEREGAESRKTIVKVLAQYPRPVWSETIYKYVRDPQSGLGIDGLQALVRVGHPKLREVLTEALQSRDATIREVAYVELTNQPDADSEAVALKFTLEHLEKSAPTPSMLAFLTKTKDQSSVPLLLKHVKNGAADRSGLINTLAQIGDQSVADALVEVYPQLRPNEQTSVLNVLGQLKSPVFIKLAGPALESSDYSIVSTVCQWLQNDASPAAAKLLIQTLEKTNNPNTVTYVANALGQIASPEARAALRKARGSNDQSKQQQARQALMILYQRSPGMPYVQQGRAFEQQQNDLKTAMEQYDLAIKTDPELPDAYTSRANLLIKKDKYAEAKKDFEKAYTLDDHNSQAVTGLAITLAVEGKFEDGIKLVEDARSRHTNDGLFLYNVACVYGRAVEQVQKNDKLPEREAKLDTFRRKAIDDLRSSLKLGFNDMAWLKKDPDLKSLHQLPEFKEVAGTKVTPPEEE